MALPNVNDDDTDGGARPGFFRRAAEGIVDAVNPLNQLLRNPYAIPSVRANNSSLDAQERGLIRPNVTDTLRGKDPALAPNTPQVGRDNSNPFNNGDEQSNRSSNVLENINNSIMQSNIQLNKIVAGINNISSVLVSLDQSIRAQVKPIERDEVTSSRLNIPNNLGAETSRVGAAGIQAAAPVLPTTAGGDSDGPSILPVIPLRPRVAPVTPAPTARPQSRLRSLASKATETVRNTASKAKGAVASRGATIAGAARTAVPRIAAAAAPAIAAIAPLAAVVGAGEIAYELAGGDEELARTREQTAERSESAQMRDNENTGVQQPQAFLRPAVGNNENIPQPNVENIPADKRVLITRMRESLVNLRRDYNAASDDEAKREIMNEYNSTRENYMRTVKAVTGEDVNVDPLVLPSVSAPTTPPVAAVTPGAPAPYVPGTQPYAPARETPYYPPNPGPNGSASIYATGRDAQGQEPVANPTVTPAPTTTPSVDPNQLPRVAPAEIQVIERGNAPDPNRQIYVNPSIPVPTPALEAVPVPNIQLAPQMPIELNGGVYVPGTESHRLAPDNSQRVGRTNSLELRNTRQLGTQQQQPIIVPMPAPAPPPPPATPPRGNQQQKSSVNLPSFSDYKTFGSNY